MFYTETIHLMGNVRLTTWFGVCILAMLCGAGSLKAYDYADYFTPSKAELDSYRHSVFSPKGQVPPSEPYLYYIEISKNWGLAFADYKGRDAELRYRFPVAVESAQRVVKGVLALDVSFPSAEISQIIPGHLQVQTSPDGMAWSSADPLEAGYHEIPITSASGYCYVWFSGTRVVIDNLSVYLSSTPVTIRVPRDFATIQAAIDAAGDGDVIELAKDNIYSGPGNRDIDFRGKAITVCGVVGAAKNTIIDCGGSTASAEGNHRGFYFHQSEGADSVLSDVTIRGGRVFGSQVPPDPLRNPNPAYAIGGGIYCEGAGPTIENCIIEDCWADLGGGIGGVGAQPEIADCVIEECVLGKSATTTSGGRGGAIGLIGNSSATITNCIIRGNSGNRSSYGAGLYFQQSSATVVGCVISDNTTDTTGRGGGAYCGAATTNVAFRNCIFSANFANAGAGIYAEWAMDTSLPPAIRSERCRVNAINCTVARNELIGSMTPTSAGGVQSSGADIVITSSILWFNKGKALVIADSTLRGTVTYCDIEGGYSGFGNINLPPQFAASEDYHLKSRNGRYDPQAQRWVADTISSPCIDTGDPSASVGDEPPANGNRINMGAYGGTKQASKSPEHFTFHVDPGRKSGLNAAQTFLTVQAAIDVAKDGDKVLVWPGPYDEDIDFKGKAITVQSAADAAVLTSSRTGYAVTFRAGGPGSVLANFVISGCGQAGIYCDAASPTLRNLTIVGNSSGIAAYSGSEPNVTNCIFWKNRDADLYGDRAPKPRFSNIQYGAVDKNMGNMQTDPLFADPDRGDYHLKSSAGRWDSWSETWVIDTKTSPCIDAGHPKDDYSGEPMPNGGRIDMGAHGGTPYASKSIR